MRWSISDPWISEALAAWLASLVGDAASGVAVAFGAPGPNGGPAAGAAGAARGLNLHLVSVAPDPRATPGGPRRTEVRLVLRYLATSWAADRAAADALLCALAFRLLGKGATGPDGESDVVVETAPPALELFVALGIAPRPALVFELPLAQVEVVAPAKRVLFPPVVEAGIADALWGRLVGPDDVPVAAAQVEFPSFGRVTQTDATGQFRFTGVPADLAGHTLRVRARGVERNYQLAGGDSGPVMLRMSFAEEG
jgi:hypothetical protein